MGLTIFQDVKAPYESSKPYVKVNSPPDTPNRPYSGRILWSLEKLLIFLSMFFLLHPIHSSSIPLKVTAETMSMEISVDFIPIKLCMNIAERPQLESL